MNIKIIKKIIVCILVTVFSFHFFGCSNSNKDESGKNKDYIISFDVGQYAEPMAKITIKYGENFTVNDPIILNEYLGEYEFEYWTLDGINKYDIPEKYNETKDICLIAKYVLVWSKDY